jgi:hypothetical protein
MSYAASRSKRRARGADCGGVAWVCCVGPEIEPEPALGNVTRVHVGGAEVDVSIGGGGASDGGDSGNGSVLSSLLLLSPPVPPPLVEQQT